MANMSMTKNPIPEQEPLVRNKNFDEVALGYTEEIAIDEAKRCLNCRQHPCVSGCPVNVRIPEFIAKVAEGEFEEAYKIITSTNSLPAVCGRVCPQEHQCEGKCVRGIKGESVGIGRLERFVADWHAAHADPNAKVEKPVSNGHRVAVVGSGPAGLTCAGDLAQHGLRSHRVRAVPQGRRRSGVRYPRVPSAQGDRGARSRRRSKRWALRS